MKIILLAGVIGSGKSYFANEYKRTHPEENVHELHFAAPLRNICGKLFNFDASSEAEYEAFKAIPENRMFMVRLGKEMKAEMGDNLFARATADLVKQIGINFGTPDNNITILISDFRFPVEFWTMLQAFPNNLVITFCNYHSERYELRPEQVSEQMAIWLLGKGIEDRTELGVGFFARLMKDYENVK